MENISPADVVSEQSRTDEKRELEIAKLKEEIKEIQKKWFKKPQIVLGILPALIALFSVFFLYKNGTFDIQTKQLKLTRDQLQLDISKFDDTIRNYNIEKNKIIAETNQLRDSLQNTRQNLATIELNNTAMKRAVDSLKMKISSSTNQQEKQESIKKLYNIIDNYIIENKRFKTKIALLEIVLSESKLQKSSIAQQALTQEDRVTSNQKDGYESDEYILFTGSTGKGAQAFIVAPGSWAEKSGISMLDIITQIGNEKIKSKEDYFRVTKKIKRGELIKVVFMHGDKEIVAETNFQ